jgi:hypothetical protein
MNTGEIHFYKNFYTNVFVITKNYPTFVSNNTCHASHLNSAPGQVFVFYRYFISTPSISHFYAIQ